MTATTIEAHLPNDLDYSASYDVHPSDDAPNDVAFNPDWEEALCYDTPDVREFLINGGLYHQRISDTFLLAYNFTFRIDDQDRIVAHGVVHPATQRRDDYHTDESVIISQATIIISPADPAADLALRTYVQAHHMAQPPGH